jgi:hypothetical protein
MAVDETRTHSPGGRRAAGALGGDWQQLTDGYPIQST